jgi:polyketide biosynthesis enoyl-CoA hydratase PksH
VSYQTIAIRPTEKLLHITLAAGNGSNAIDDVMLTELHDVLGGAADDANCRAVVLRAEGEIFCAGLDIAGMAKRTQVAGRGAEHGTEQFLSLLQRIASMPKIVVAVVDGKVSAGGVGIVAACDLVVSGRKSQFSLPEALWGLLPCCVLPYLARRIGVQKARCMMLTTQALDAQEAHRIHLVDELADDPERLAKRHLMRIGNLHPETIISMKQLVNRLAPIAQADQQYVLHETTRLLSSPRVVGNIKTFVESGRFPWEQ